ncbi:hypothetical protein RHOSPDRAFT_33832 [Rhodotorula sp. JG-1b]|nr:hypothetical protein RHOSPDRAFT_33832 [Rhodotorula sp. JG-1b]
MRNRSPAFSPTALGSAYENATRAFLSRPPFSIHGLLSVGGAGDGGVDLRGRWTWQPPPPSPFPRLGGHAVGFLNLANGASPHTLSAHDKREPVDDEARLQTWDVLVQCKAEKEHLGPAVVRQLEGSILTDLARRNPPRRSLAPPQTTTTTVPGGRDTAPIGILVGLSGFSRAAILHAQTSAVPIVLAHLSIQNIPQMIATRGESDIGASLVSASVNKAFRRLIQAAFPLPNEAGSVSDGGESSCA